MTYRSSLIDEVGVRAQYYQEKYGGCGQAVVGAFRSVLGDDVIPEAVFKSATGLSGGCAQTGNICGAISGGILVLSLFSGRDESTWDDMSKKEETYKLGRKLVSYFIDTYGDINCDEIKNNIVSKHIAEDSIKMSEAGEKEADCSVITRKAAMKVMEILKSEGYIRP